MIRASIREGLQRTIRSWRMLLPLYLINLLVAVIAVAPVAQVVQHYWGPSLLSTSLRKGLNFTAIYELLLYNAAAIRPIIMLWLILFMVYEVLSIFLDGGIISALKSGESRGISRRLFGEGAAYFWRFMRLFFISLVAYLITALLAKLVDSILARLMANSTLHTEILLILLIRIIIAAFFLAFTRMVMDYSKVITVLENSRTMRHSVWKGLKFSVSHFSKTYGMFLSLLFIYIITVALQTAVNYSINETTASLVVMLFVVEQLFLFTRVGERVWFYGSELSLYEAVQQLAQTEVGEEPLTTAVSERSEI
ncbi:MAG: hypothetical protein ACP5ON_01465 [Bacteroidota bacterium]